MQQRVYKIEKADKNQQRQPYFYDAGKKLDLTYNIAVSGFSPLDRVVRRHLEDI